MGRPGIAFRGPASLAGSRASIETDSGRLAIESLDGGTVRIVWPADHGAPPPSFAVEKEPALGPAIEPSDSSAGHLLRIGRLQILVTRSSLSFLDEDGARLLEGDPDWLVPTRPGFRLVFRLYGDERFYGFGEKAGGLERSRRSMVFWNRDKPFYGQDEDPLYTSVPFFLLMRGERALGVFLDNASRSFADTGAADPDRLVLGAEGGGPLVLYVLPGPDPKQVIQAETTLTGRMPLPPLWALGYHQSRWSYVPQERVLQLASTFRSRRIPCDAIHLDIDTLDRFRPFTWDRERFPDPKGLLARLASEGFHSVAIVNPGIPADETYEVYRLGVEDGHFVRRADGNLYLGKVWPGPCAFPDFTREATRRWFGELYRGLLEDGVAGFWNDMNEPAVHDGPGGTFPDDIQHEAGAHRDVHNAYGMLMSRATYEGLRRLDGHRPFVLTRSTYAGGQRYAATWTGDNRSGWEDLRASIAMCLNLGLSGHPFSGADIGGFQGSPSAELYGRWLEAAAVFPFCRTHSVQGSPDQEPWSFGPEWEQLNRRSIELRYRFLPYLYSVFEEASRTGLPILRPLFLDDPEDRELARCDDEFLLGEAVLVAPVTEPGAAARKVRFPRGTWIHFWCGFFFEGPSEHEVAAPPGRLPLFIREGTVLPMAPVRQHTGVDLDPLVLEVFSKGRASGRLYEDDGWSHAHEAGGFRESTFEFEKGKGAIRLARRLVHDGYAPPPRRVLLRLHGVRRRPGAIRWNGSPIQGVPEGELKTTEGGWHLDEETRTLEIVAREPEGEWGLEGDLQIED